MRFSSFLFTAFAMLLFFAFTSCEQDSLSSSPEVLTPTTDLIIKDPGIPLHPGTTTERLSDSELALFLPEDVFFIYSDENKARYGGETGVGTITCECTQGEGCNPTDIDGTATCIMMADCSSYDKETSLPISPGKSKKQLITIHGLVDYNQGITWVTPELTGDPLKDVFFSVRENSLGNAYPEFFESPRVQAGIRKFLNDFYANDIPDFLLDQDAELPENYGYFEMNVFGSLLSFPFPKELAGQKVGNNPGDYIGGGKGTCDCLSVPSGGCTYETQGFGKIKYCDAGTCTKCRLTL